MKAQLQEFNNIITELFTAYHQMASKLGVTENELWILYELLSTEDGLLQRELCERLGLPKQTVNSALQKMKQAGQIKQNMGKDRRTKLVSLTEAGRQLAEQKAGWLMQAESAALGAMGPEKRDGLFTGLRDYIRELKKQ